MRDGERMREIEAKMQICTLPIVKVPSGSGWAYWLDGRSLPAQIVSDMIADGWLREGAAMNGMPTLELIRPTG